MNAPKLLAQIARARTLATAYETMNMSVDNLKAATDSEWAMLTTLVRSRSFNGDKKDVDFHPPSDETKALTILVLEERGHAVQGPELVKKKGKK